MKFEEVKEGNFWMVNRQHCVAILKQIQEMDRIPDKKKEVQEVGMLCCLE